MKKILFTAVCAALSLPVLAEPAVCAQYHQKMEAALKAEGNYSPEAMKIVTDQTAAIPPAQQEAFCQAGLDGLNSQYGEGTGGS